LCKLDSGKSHGNWTGTDGGIGTYFFGGAERMLKQPPQLFVKRTRLASGLIGRFHLPENLRLTQDHRVQSAGDPAHVADQCTVGIAVQVRRKLVGIELPVGRQPINENLGIGRFGFAIQFGAITGGKDGGFRDITIAPKVTQG
jgi:hypothetical protein